MEELVHLSFFSQIGKAIVASNSLSGILNNVMEQIGKIFSPMNWSLLLKDPKSNELVFKIVVGEAADQLQDARIPIDRGISGWIARTGQAVIIEDVSKDHRFSDHLDKQTGFTTTSIIGVPLKTENKVIGVIELINKLNGETFSPLELNVLSTIADFSAIAIEKAYYIQAIKRISRIDHLTGCLNRRSMDQILKREIERSKRQNLPLSVLLVDIDKFKQINDQMGHGHGDQVLKACSRLLHDHIRSIDFLVRYGGDEFAVIMPNTDRSAAEQVRLRILQEIKKQEHQDYAFSASIGLGTLDRAGHGDIDTLLKASDKDMYQQKQPQQEAIEIDKNLFAFYEHEEEERVQT